MATTRTIGQIGQAVRIGARRPVLRRVASGLPSLPLAIWVGLFVGVPGIFMLVFSFQTYTFYDVELPWTIQNYIDLVTAGSYAKLFIKTIIIAVVVTVGALTLGSPFAYYISRVAGKRLAVFLLLVTVLPLWMNVIIRNYSWIALITNNGVLNTALDAVGLPKLDIIYTLQIVIVVGITLALPFAVLVLYAAMGSISNEVEEASLDLGSNRLQTFLKVIFPLSASGYQTAALLIFMPTLAFYVTPMMLGGTDGAMVATALMPVVRDVLDFAQGGGLHRAHCRHINGDGLSLSQRTQHRQPVSFWSGVEYSPAHSAQQSVAPYLRPHHTGHKLSATVQHGAFLIWQ